MRIQLRNNASGTLATAINASDTGIVLTTGNGANFPVLGLGDYFYATLESTGGTFEVIRVTARSGDSMTVLRAQEGSIANSFAAGSRLELRVTAQSVIDTAQQFVTDADLSLRNDLAAPSGSSIVGFQQAGSGTVLRTAQAKLRETVSVMDFGAVGDGVTDDRQAFIDAIATGKAVYVPDTGNSAYYISAPIPSVPFTTLFGDAEVLVGATRTARIYAPEGFLVNLTSPAVRHRIVLTNIEIYGQGRAVAGKIGISGQFGGKLEGVYLRGFDTLMENNFAFVLDFVRCKFEDANIGLYLSTANETNVTNCFFGSSCIKAIDTYNLTPGVSGERAAKPFSVTTTNFNFGSITIPSVFSGELRFVGNYAEAFSAPTSSIALFEYVAMRFANSTLYIADNHLNGQGNVDRCWHIYSDNASGSTIQGQITRNFMRGYNQLPVLIGNKAGFSNSVGGINVFGNQTNSVQVVSYDATISRIPFEQVMVVTYSDSLDISGSTYVRIPITAASGFNVDIDANRIKIRQPGLYRITVDVQFAYATSARNCQLRINRNGAGIADAAQTLPAVVAGGDNFQSVQIETLRYLSAADDLFFEARNGDRVTSARMTVQRIPGADQYVGY